jgi:hypothetical protein
VGQFSFGCREERTQKKKKKQKEKKNKRDAIPDVSMRLATSLAVIGALALSFLSCRAYPKQGITCGLLVLVLFRDLREKKIEKKDRSNSTCRRSLESINHDQQLHDALCWHKKKIEKKNQKKGIEKNKKK